MEKEEIKKTSAEKVDRVDKALQKFADMMIQRMEEIQKDWKKVGQTDLQEEVYPKTFLADPM